MGPIYPSASKWWLKTNCSHKISDWYVESSFNLQNKCNEWLSIFYITHEYCNQISKWKIIFQFQFKNKLKTYLWYVNLQLLIPDSVPFFILYFNTFSVFISPSQSGKCNGSLDSTTPLIPSTIILKVLSAPFVKHFTSL